MKNQICILITAVILTVASAPVLAQDTEPTISQIETVAKLFEGQHLLILQHVEEYGWSDFSEKHKTAFSNHATSIQRMLENPRTFKRDGFQDNYQQYNAYAEDLYSDSSEYKSIILIPFVYRVQEILFELFDKDLEKYYRMVDIRYGKLSEKLNLLEIAISNKWFSPRTTGTSINYPKVAEPILRIQTVGYQYYGDSDEFLPSSPIMQIGASFYLYGDSKFEKWANHIGIAAAYERDLVTKNNYFGGMLHIRNFDIGLLMDPENKAKVLAASFNVQLIKGIF